METKKQKAKDFFESGYNCGQASSMPFAQEAGLSEAAVARMMAGFGGGLGGSRDLCGAVSGMVWAIGVLHGNYDPTNNEAKTAFYERVKKAVDTFTAEFGTTNCRELLEASGCLATSTPSERTQDYYAKRPCAYLVERAAEIATHA